MILLTTGTFDGRRLDMFLNTRITENRLDGFQPQTNHFYTSWVKIHITNTIISGISNAI